MKLISVRLLVADFTTSFRFYQDIMGFKCVWGSEEEGGYADFEVGESTGIALFDRAVMTAELGTAALPAFALSQDSVALIFSVDNIDSAHADLIAKGATFITEPTDHPDWGIRVAYLRDPDANLIEINTAMPHEQWNEELLEENARYANQEQSEH